jgi:hypothetical protein
MPKDRLGSVSVRLHERNGAPLARVMNRKTREVIAEPSARTWSELIDALTYYRGPNRDRDLIIEEEMPESARQYFASLEIELFGERKKF